MNEPPTSVYEFGEFRLDSAKRLLFKADNESIPLMPKAFDTLLYLVQNSGKVIEKDELMREIWADTIVEENNLNQNISILRKVLGEKRGDHRFIATIPGHGYKFVADVREVSNRESESEIADPEAEEKKYQPPQTADFISRYKVPIAAVLVLIAAISAVYIFYFRQKSSSERPPRSIAVLPFKPLVAGDRDEVLEMGMADTLIAKLSGQQEIVVRPLSSVRRFGNLEQDPQTAGRNLGVDLILDGSIQRAKDKIRVNVRLINVLDGASLWSGTFDEKFTDIFVVQDAISEKVSEALKIRIGKKRQTENVEAYQLYLKGRYHTLKLILPEVEKGIGNFEQAIKIDSNYALAYAGQAEAYRVLSLTNDFPANETMPKAKAAALRAIEIDPTLAEAHAVLAWIAFFYDWNWPEAEKLCLQGLKFDPNNADIHTAYAHLLSNTGRHSEALAEIKRAKELDPVSLRINALEGQFLLHAGKTDAAIEELQKTLELDADFWLAYLFLSSAYIEKEMYDKALVEASKAKEFSLGHTQSLAYKSFILAKAGRKNEAKAALDELSGLSEKKYVPPYNLALAYNGLGENGKALDHLEKAYEEKNLLLVFLKVEPKWNDLRNEPRFIELMRRMNFE